LFEDHQGRHVASRPQLEDELSPGSGEGELAAVVSRRSGLTEAMNAICSTAAFEPEHEPTQVRAKQLRAHQRS